MSKEAKNVFPMHNFLKKRWSPRAFSDLPVEKEKIRSLFEAARWSPSAGNMQPWRFMVGFKGDTTYQKIFETLDDGNKIWVHLCPVLVLSIGKSVVKDTNEHYSVFKYDVGQAVAHLTFQAMDQGLMVHQMGGFEPQKAIDSFHIPAKYEPLTVIAIGYIGKADLLPDKLKTRELAERSRNEFTDFVFMNTFGEASSVFSEIS